MLARAFQDYFADVGRIVINPRGVLGPPCARRRAKLCCDNGAVIGTTGRKEWGKVRT
jgi:hypothetical protein